jgi:hypothetical protein
MPLLIIFLSFLYCLSNATLTLFIFDKSDKANLPIPNINIPDDQSAKDLELYLMNHYYDDGYPIFIFLIGDHSQSKRVLLSSTAHIYDDNKGPLWRRVCSSRRLDVEKI